MLACVFFCWDILNEDSGLELVENDHCVAVYRMIRLQSERWNRQPLQRANLSNYGKEAILFCASGEAVTLWKNTPTTFAFEDLWRESDDSRSKICGNSQLLKPDTGCIVIAS